MFVLQNVMSENLGAISKELKRNSSNLEEAVRREQTKLNGGERSSITGWWLWAGQRPNTQNTCCFVFFLIAAIKGTLQTAKNKLADLRRKKEQLLSQLQSVQDMLGRDQGLSWVLSAPILTSSLQPKAASSPLLTVSGIFLLSFQRTPRRQSRMPKQLQQRPTRQLQEWKRP